MTREDAKEKAKAVLIEATENEDAVSYVTNVDKEWLEMAIEALEQESILDKIRAEIEDLDFFYDNDYSSSNKDAMFKCNEVLAIFDKYKAESEDKG